jgi:hypothetical protein
MWRGGVSGSAASESGYRKIEMSKWRNVKPMKIMKMA